MATAMRSFERDYEFPRVIVWDALVDADLVSGWLAEAAISGEIGGEYELRWMHRPGQPVSHGHVALLERPERLHVEMADMNLRFELAEIPGGNRGTSTRLRLTVELELDPARSARLQADWLTSLDQLRDLLYGHPVNWATWGQDMRETWSQHLDEVGNSSA